MLHHGWRQDLQFRIEIEIAQLRPRLRQTQINLLQLWAPYSPVFFAEPTISRLENDDSPDVGSYFGTWISWISKT